MARVALLCALGLLLLACSGSSSDANPPVEANTSGCLDRPGELPRPPAGKLPCELLPPGLSLK